MNKILWCTSFNKDLYFNSGQLLLQSFITSKSEGHWFISFEDEELSNQLFVDKTHTVFNLKDSDFLNKWLKKNRDIT